MMHVLFERGLRGSTTTSRAHARHRRSCASARASTRRSASARSPAFRAETIVVARRAVRPREGGVHPRELRPAAARAAAAWPCARSRACRRSPAIGGAPAAACSSRRARTSSSTSAALERPDLSPPVRTINMIRLGEALTTPDAGVGGPPVRALVVYNSNPAAVAPDRNAVLRGHARARICSPSCSSISRPTPPTTPTSCCRRRRSSSTGTCTTRTATTTSRSTSRRSSRSASRSRTARSSAGSRRGWGSIDPCCATTTSTLIRQALDVDEREAAAA